MAVEELKRWASEAGFDRCGIAALGPSAHGEALRSWLECGHAAGMDYLGRRVEERLDPSVLVPWARSVLCVALQYGNASRSIPEGDLWRGVARYATGDDYHELMGKRLAALSSRIEEGFPGSRTRWYVDTGPVLEREIAERAGLGAIGKNTNLLHPEAGSYFFLGEIFLSLDLTPDVPMADLCGSCTRCLEACPTGALVEPWVLDANRCISYWSIEHRGELPTERRAGQGEWVFGCDICQEVCPWNGDLTQAVDPALELPEKRRSMGLVDLLRLERGDYVELFRHSPMKRAKLEGLRRNAVVAMGNSGEEKYVDVLAATLNDEDPDVSSHAAWALGEIGGARAGEALRQKLSELQHGGLLESVELALSHCE